MSDATADRPYQPETAPALKVSLAGLGILAGLGVVLAAVYGLGVLMAGPPPGPVEARRRAYDVPAGPRASHWPDPPADLRRQRERAAERLDGYGWVDPSTGVVRLPIERAMELVAGERASASGAQGPASPGAEH